MGAVLIGARGERRGRRTRRCSRRSAVQFWVGPLRGPSSSSRASQLNASTLGGRTIIKDKRIYANVADLSAFGGGVPGGNGVG